MFQVAKAFPPVENVDSCYAKLAQLLQDLFQAAN
jgi:hypothetical protein